MRLDRYIINHNIYMPPKKRKRKAKPTGQRQSQRQSVVVNIGSKSTPRKSSGRGNLPPPSHAHNLAPTFVTAPQIDYTPLLAMMQHHASPIVAQAPLPVTTTPLSASVQASNSEQMAGEAAIRRAGPTAASFQPIGHMEREIQAGLREKTPSSPPSSRSSSPTSSRSSISPSMASTRVSLPEGRASVSTIKQMGAAEERGRAAREEANLAARRKAFAGLQDTARKGKIKLISQELEKVKPSNVTPELRTNFRQAVFGAGLNLTDLTGSAQSRTREPRF